MSKEKKLTTINPAKEIKSETIYSSSISPCNDSNKESSLDLDSSKVLELSSKNDSNINPSLEANNDSSKALETLDKISSYEGIPTMEHILRECANSGITLDFMLKCLKEGLVSTRWVYSKDGGAVLENDMATRHKWWESGIKLMGLVKDRPIVEISLSTEAQASLELHRMVCEN